MSTANIFPQFNKTAAIDGNVVLNRTNDIGICYKMELPEIFTLGESDFDHIHSDFLKIFSNLPEDTIVHKKDIFKQEYFDREVLKKDTFLQNSIYEHFGKRSFIKHQCIITFIKASTSTSQRNFDKVSLTKKNTSTASLAQIDLFNSSIEQVISSTNSSYYFKLTPLTEQEILNFIIDEYTLFGDTIGDYVPQDDCIKIGDNFINILSLRDDGQQKDGMISNCVLDNKKSTDKSKFFRSYTYPLGIEFNENHIFNQYIFLENQQKLKKILEANTKRLTSSSLLNRQNRILAEQNDAFLTRVENDNVKIVRTHANVVIWSDDKEKLKNTRNRVVGYFSEMEIIPYTNSKFDQDYIYQANFLGNGGLMPNEETFLTYLDLALCYWTTETNYKTDDNGLLFNDRINNVPIYIDVFNKPYENKDITNRNYVVVAPSGGGKSFLIKSKLRQQIENPNNSTVVLNVGGDDKLCRVYPDDCLYFEYIEGQPLDLNPFWVFNNTITAGKIDFLIDFINLLWGQKEDEITSDIYSSLEKIILMFYGIDFHYTIDSLNEKEYEVKNMESNSLQDFFKFIKEKKEEIKVATNDLIKIDSLVLNLEKYAIGIYSNLFTNGVPKTFENKKYIEFELDNIKDHKILFPVFGMIISDLVFNTMWKNDGKEKDFFIDEAWKVLEKKGMASLLKYLYKTIRKFNGSVGIAVQQITDLAPLGEADEKAILGNTAIKYLLDHREAESDVPILKEKLSMRDSDVSMLMSIENNTKPTVGNPLAYTELLLMKGSRDSKIVRLEVSLPCLAIFESDKDKLKVFNELYKYHHHSIKPTIADYIEVEIKKNKKMKDFIF